MEFNRRGFLILISGGSLISPSVVSAAPNRYKQLVEFQHHLVKSGIPIAEDLKYLKKIGAWKPARQHPGHAAFCAEADYFLSWMLENFNNSDLNDPNVIMGVRALFGADDKRIVIDTMDERQLRMTEDAVIVVAVLKNMIHQEVPIDTMKMPHVDIFAHRYKNLILG